MNVLKNMFSGVGGPGCALIVGALLLIVTGLLLPGGPIIDNVDLTDLEASLGAMSDNDTLTHVMTLLAILGSLAVAFGLFSFFRLSGDEGSTGHAFLRFGLVLNLFHYGIFILSGGLRHFLLIVADGGVETGGQDQAIAMNLHSASIGLHFALLTVSSIGGILVGVGLARRFASLNVFASACWLLALAGLAGLVNVVVGEHVGSDLEAPALISSIVLFVGAVCLIVIGYGVHTGQSELVAGDS